MILGKGSIVAASGYISYMYFTEIYPQLTQPLMPALIVAMISYLVGSLFLSIFSFSCTAILHCFILDEDTGGSTNTPESLKNFLDYNDDKSGYKERKDAPSGANKIE